MLITGMLVFVLTPFLAPLAMHQGWTLLGKIIYTLYSPFCHQLPQRSWFLFGAHFTYPLTYIAQVAGSGDPVQLRSFYGSPTMGWKVAWSDRMVSFYGMIPLFGLLYLMWRRIRPSFGPISWRMLVLLLAPMFVDGFTHMLNDIFYGVSGAGFRDSNHWLAWMTLDTYPAFYAGDQFGTFNWWMRLLTGVLAAWGVALFLFPWLEKLFHDELSQLASANENS